VFVALPILFAATSPFWLPRVGTSLEDSGQPRKADIAVVLGGDFFGNRILKAAELAREGYVPKVLVSGPSGQYSFHESDLAIPFAVKHGFPESLFVPAPNDTRSTRDEAVSLVPLLRRMGVHSFLLVTSDFHTRRAARLFRSAAPEMRVFAVAAPDAEFQLESWWKAREGRKSVFLEWTKTFATWLGM
jgi:uncharacterized SAM-binding protein YcdF (DUF218 family)